MNNVFLRVAAGLLVVGAAGLLAAAAVREPVSGQRATQPTLAPPGGDLSPEERLYSEALSRVRLESPVSFRGLTVFPLLAKSSPRFYITLDEAMAAKEIDITDSGRVEDVNVKNTGNRHVLIVDGEEIVGAKQNRVFNSSLMVAPGQTVVAKVSCVEQGRWSTASTGFGTSGTQLFARARQMNTQAVAGNMAASSTPVGDQTEVWDRVARKNEALGVPSETRAMHEAYKLRQEDVDAYVKQFQPLKTQVGAVFAIRGEIVGLDLFDDAGTLEKMYPKLVRSYALDAISPEPNVKTSAGAPEKPAPDMDSARGFLASAREARGKSYPSQGEGRDLRVQGWKVSGASLIVKGAPVHTAVFTSSDRPQTEDGAIRPMAPPSGRRR